MTTERARLAGCNGTAVDAERLLLDSHAARRSRLVWREAGLTRLIAFLAIATKSAGAQPAVLAPPRGHICDPGQRSRTMSPWGREQQISTLPSAGGSTGSGRYSTAPRMSPVSQEWHTPVRHAHRTGTSHASASSRMLSKAGAHGTFRPLRAKDTNGPTPADSAGWWGSRRGAAAMSSADLSRKSRCGCGWRRHPKH